MKYSKDKAIFGWLCMCEKGKLWFNWKDITDNLLLVGIAKSVVTKFGTKKQKEEFKKFLQKRK